MSDLIDRDETIKQFCKQDCGCDPKDCPDKTCYEVEIIESVPTHPTSSNTLGALDCVERQAAIDEIDEWIKAFRENGHKESAADACLIQDGIIQLPSAQPRKGKWIRHTKVEPVYSIDGVETWGIKCQCDKCCFATTVVEGFGYYNFCPNCGADLRPQFEEPEINPCRGCEDYDGKGGCKTKGGCAGSRGDSE